jgi:hypothetical protein
LPFISPWAPAPFTTCCSCGRVDLGMDAFVLRQQSHRWRRVCRTRRRIAVAVAVGISDNVVGWTCLPPQATGEDKTSVKTSIRRKDPSAAGYFVPAVALVDFAFLVRWRLTAQVWSMQPVHPTRASAACCCRSTIQRGRRYVLDGGQLQPPPVALIAGTGRRLLAAPDAGWLFGVIVGGERRSGAT